MQPVCEAELQDIRPRGSCQTARQARRTSGALSHKKGHILPPVLRAECVLSLYLKDSACCIILHSFRQVLLRRCRRKPLRSPLLSRVASEYGSFA